ncbi:MAG: hypothetical protein C0605_12530 [Hyphomicrobiales bacterium]|nr:MAG: hypothetical protein C0605_12530 [Hyphomicrobiales bacterium]
MSGFFGGLDIGSATTKAAIVSEDAVLGHAVVATGVHCDETARNLMNQVIEAHGLQFGDLKGVTTTGYGRRLVSFATGTISEITANVRGAVWYGQQGGRQIRTIINIGGQDSKVISLDEQGVTKNFSMNDKCAAGTGRFLESLARILEVNLTELGDIALEAEVPIRINSTCTVFAESEIISLIARGRKKSEIVAGAHYAIANRLARMARRVGVVDQVFFDGGPALNRGLVEAVENEIAAELYVPPDVPQVTTAVGAALIARDEYLYGAETDELPKARRMNREAECNLCP